MPTKAVDLTELPRTDTSEVDVSDFQNANIMCEQDGRLYRMPMKQVENTMFSDFSTLKEYGVCYDEITKEPTLIRVGASTGLVAGVAVGDDTSVVNDFDDIYPWSEMKRCTVADDGTVTAYEGEPGYIEDGSIGQVMVEIPKFYIKRLTDKSNHKVYTYVCQSKLAGYRTPEAFKDRNGNELSHIYIGAYVSTNTSTANSVYDKMSLGGEYQDYANNMVSASNRGEGWHNLDIREISDVLQLLFIVEFATLNSASVFNGGLCGWDDLNPDFVIVESSNSANLTDKKNKVTLESVEGNILYVGMMALIAVSPEETDFVPGEFDFLDDEQYYARRTITDVVRDGVSGNVTVTFDGSPIFISADTEFSLSSFNGHCNNIKASSGILGDGEYGVTPFKWRGFENIFCFYGIWVGGIMGNTATSKNFMFNPALSKQKLTTLDEFVDTGILIPADGYISKIVDSKDYPYLALPVETKATSNTGYCNEFTDSGGGTKGLLWGATGLFSFSLSTSRYFSGRLAYSRF